MSLFKSLAFGAWVAATVAHGHSHHAQEVQNPLPQPRTSCEHPSYQSHIVSKSPLVIYLDGFLTLKEAAHLQDITRDTFSRSAVADHVGVQGQRQTRTSQSTSVARDDVVRCIEERALSFQGFDTAQTYLEPLQLVKYGRGESYHFHTDWFTSSQTQQASSSLGGNRQSSFFAYVSAENITGGGTNFPMLSPPRDERWCAFIDCDEPWENGLSFRPLVGNAVFWSNLLADGTGDQRTLHAGLPVTSGSKIGMNIWTRQGPLSEEFRGKE
ncbi:2OG-Fe(II) oxygenase superfamily protein [Xylariaceae sp. FL0594]|nr:2OG-Fe(II) oxygenase superfamily protein [Xylariaceae sp. FL0594]